MNKNAESEPAAFHPPNLRQHLKKTIGKVLYGETRPFARIYPESVQYALQEAGAILHKPEIESLIDSGFLPEATYLVAKAFANDSTNQLYFLRDLTEIYLNYDQEKHRHLLKKFLTILPDKLDLKAGKLAQLSRVGNDFWQEKFHEMAFDCFQTDPKSIPILAAYAVLLGYRHFVEAYTQHHDPIHLLLVIPEWIKNNHNPDCGFVITIDDTVAVTVFAKSQAKTFLPDPERAWFVDDTIKTGNSAQVLRTFWKEYTGDEIPASRVRALTDLRKAQLI